MVSCFTQPHPTLYTALDVCLNWKPVPWTSFRTVLICWTHGGLELTLQKVGVLWALWPQHSLTAFHHFTWSTTLRRLVHIGILRSDWSCCTGDSLSQYQAIVQFFEWVSENFWQHSAVHWNGWLHDHSVRCLLYANPTIPSVTVVLFGVIFFRWYQNDVPLLELCFSYFFCAFLIVLLRKLCVFN